MKPLYSKWMYWASFVTPITLEEGSSEVNEEVAVRLSKGRIQLLSNNCIYSFDDYYINFLETFEQIQIKRFQPQTVLVLGLGTGSVVFMLEKKFGIKADYTLIEKDDLIIEMATKYSLGRIKSPFTVIEADAYQFVLANEKQYDLVIFDVFVDDIIPAEFARLKYLKALKEAVVPGGILLYNKLYRMEQDQKESDRFFKEKFAPVMPEAKQIIVKGNCIIYYAKEKTTE